MATRRLVFTLLWLLFVKNVVFGDDVRQRLDSDDRSVKSPPDDFQGLSLGPSKKEQRNLAAPVTTKEYDAAGMRTTARPRSKYELERGHLASSTQKQSPSTEEHHRKPKATVRNLTFQSCGKGGTQYVVECMAGSEEHCHQELTEAGASIVNELPGSAFFAVCVDTRKEMDLLKQLTDVVDVEEDYIRTLSHRLTKRIDSRRLQGRQDIPYGVEMVKAPEFWEATKEKGEGVTVCIIDTGLNLQHEDIDGAIVSGSTSNSVVSDWGDDDAGHGTHVAGIIAARDNFVGIVGVAPEAELFIVRVFEGQDSRFAATSLVAAMTECEKGGADIINMSLGGPNSSTVEQNKVNQLIRNGIQLVAASGNSGLESNAEEYPAGYSAVISVGAVDQNREIAVFSTHNNQVDVTAPGVDILSLTDSCSSCYGENSGTSMASPHVAGAFALLMSAYPNKSIAAIREALEESSTDVGACGLDKVYGHGIIDLMAAANYLEDGVEAPELTGCVDVKVTIGTDKWGAETFYMIKNEDGEIVYRGGPFENEIQSNSEEFELPPGCYEFLLLDSYGKCG
ncbi:MAG: hypothetical protein SGILL_006509 [Bacillariaceae sp.]